MTWSAKTTVRGFEVYDLNPSRAEVSRGHTFTFGKVAWRAPQNSLARVGDHVDVHVPVGAASKANEMAIVQLDTGHVEIWSKDEIKSAIVNETI